MLKSLLLASTRPLYAPDDEGKSAAAKEREKIKISDSTDNDKTDDGKGDEGKKEETNSNDDDKGKEGDDSDKSDDDTGDGKDDGEKEDDEEKEDEKENETDEKKELTEDQKKLDRKIERLQRRIGKKDGDIGELKKQVQELTAQLNAKLADGEQPLTKEEVERQARELANQEVTKREFDNMQERLIKDATKIDKNFVKKVYDMSDEVAPIPGFMIGALSKLDHENGGAVLNYLTDNHDEYEDILKLNDHVKITTKLIRISDKLNEEAKPKTKKISKAPDPPKNDLKGNQTSPSVLRDNMPMDEWIALRNKQSADHRKKKLGVA